MRAHLSSPILQLSSHGECLRVRLKADLLLERTPNCLSEVLRQEFLQVTAGQGLPPLTLMGAMCFSLPLMEAKSVMSHSRFLTSSSWVISLEEVKTANSCNKHG